MTAKFSDKVAPISIGFKEVLVKQRRQAVIIHYEWPSSATAGSEESPMAEAEGPN